MRSLIRAKESKIINIASRDFTEVIVSEEFKKNNNGIIFINQGLSEERMKKNLAFLAPDAKVLFIQNPFKLYNFTSTNNLEVAREIANINLLLTEKFDFIILDYTIINRKLPPQSFFLKSIEVKQGERFGHSKLVNLLFELGYGRCETVFEFGEFAVRGFIIDIGMIEGFFRIEFDGEVIASIARFNTETQRKDLGSFTPYLILRNIKEVVLTEETLSKAKNKLPLFDIENTAGFIEDLRGFYNFSLFNFLPLFFENCANIFEFIPTDYTCFSFSNLEDILTEQRESIENLYELYTKEGRSLLKPSELIY